MTTLHTALAAVAAASVLAMPAGAAEPATGFVRISPDITLRRIVVAPAKPKGTVLLLHGFPETALAWNQVARQLGADYEVHAFDWPGYGGSGYVSAERFEAEPVPSHGLPCLLRLSLPPLAAVFLRPDR